jgi:hypothetical protein
MERTFECMQNKRKSAKNALKKIVCGDFFKHAILNGKIE